MGISTFKVPEFKLVSKRVSEIPFSGSIGTLTWLTLLSTKIPYPFRVVQAKMIFPDAANSLVRHYWHVSPTPVSSTTQELLIENIFGRESPNPFFIGKAVIKTVNCSVEYPAGNLYLILHTYNGLPIAYIINCSIVIQEM